MLDVTEKKLAELREEYERQVAWANPQFYQTTIADLKQIVAEIEEKYPEAVAIRHYVGAKKDGSRTLIHFPVSDSGVICGDGGNNTNPCPPLWL